MKNTYSKWILIVLSSILVGIIFLMSFFFISNLLVKYVIVVFATLVELSLILYSVRSERYMNHQLMQLSEVLNAHMNHQPLQLFSEVEDHMLSKIQKQLLTLTDLWTERYAHEKREKERLNSLISDISHQLKTPLANLKLYDDLLLSSDNSPEEVKTFHLRKRQQIQKLEWLMEALVKVSKMETGIICLHKKMGSLNDIILSAIDMVTPKAEERGIEIEYTLSRNIQVIADTKWLSEALFNLLDNAVKYSKAEGRVVVKPAVLSLFIRIDIEDTAATIDSSEYNNIFKRFYRIAQNADAEGVGIGLYMSRDILIRHGGYIIVEQCESGNRFSVFLPR